MKKFTWTILLISSMVIITSCKKNENEVTPTVTETDQIASGSAPSLASAASPNSLKITTIAGQPFHLGYADGPGKQALFNWPIGIDLSEDGYLYVADTNNDKVRKILLSDNSVTTVNIPNAPDGTPIDGPFTIRVAKDGTLNIIANDVWIVKPDGTVLRPGHPANSVQTDIERDPSGNFFWTAEVDTKVVNNRLDLKAYLKKFYINDVTGLLGTSPLTLDVNAIDEADRHDFDILDFYPGYNGVKYVVINHTRLYKLSSSGVFSRIYRDMVFNEIYNIVSSRDSRTLYLAESGQIKCIADGVHKFLAGPSLVYHDGRDGTGSTADIFAERLALSKDENTLYFSDLNTSTIRKMQLK
ncbi:hypothetical protein SNE25_29370 [Mucilaginibacter sabulilitoris]|uniref:NHL repeat-containing protein n=1 Tax=Mucilaginibacter sabulilitoris TaxID=1173583 RepID=A0ABZ0TJU3_9SPHI|nr:hypothetical protein [Mucilaginibacter sabulilitoris]WPU93434.1 hypothetical protein SNE25_29370 [Mucilaginibacter sabulilitoris]